MTAQALDDQLTALADVLNPLAARDDRGYPCWVHVTDYFGSEFECEGYLCKPCAHGFTARYGGDLVVDRYSPECDGSETCTTCGASLGPISLTEYGVESELEHFETSGFNGSPTDAYDLRELVISASNLDIPEAMKWRVAALRSQLGGTA